MDFSFTSDQQEFAREVDRFLEENPPDSFPIDCRDQGNSMGAFSRAFHKKLGARGYLSLTWPDEYGGRGTSVIKGVILLEQLSYHNAPWASWHMGQVVPRELMRHGSNRAKRELLPRLASGDLIFWLGYSEPEAGSDLMSLQTKVRDDGDYLVVDGQKTWSAWAHHSDWMYLLAMDPEAPRGKNLNILLVDKALPGVRVEPFMSLADELFHNMVYLDGVRVHKDFLLGERNGGLDLMLAGLESDRFWTRCSKPIWLLARLERFVRFLCTDRLGKEIARTKPGTENRIADFRVQMEVARLFSWRCAWMLERGVKLSYESSVLKYFVEDLAVRFNDFVVDTLGIRGVIRERTPPAADPLLSDYYMYGIPWTVAGGTAEIQKETIARMKWGLSRSSAAEARRKPRE